MRSAFVFAFLAPLHLLAWQATTPAALPVVLFTQWKDPNEGAFTLNVPQNWSMSGGAARRAAVDIRNVVRATSPDGRIRVFILEATPRSQF